MPDRDQTRPVRVDVNVTALPARAHHPRVFVEVEPFGQSAIIAIIATESTGDEHGVVAADPSA